MVNDLLFLEEVLVKDLLEVLVDKVDAQLLQAVGLKHLSVSSHFGATTLKTAKPFSKTLNNNYIYDKYLKAGNIQQPDVLLCCRGR